MANVISYKGQKYVRVDEAKSNAVKFLGDLNNEIKGIESSVKDIKGLISKSLSGVKSVKDADDEEEVMGKIGDNIDTKAQRLMGQVKNLNSKISKLYSPGFFE